MKLYSYWRSTAAYRVRIALNLKGLRYETVPVHLLKDGMPLTQSLAIIDYLEALWASPPLLPADPVERAQVQAAAHVMAVDIHPINNLRVVQHLEARFGATRDDSIEWMRHWSAIGFDALQRLLRPLPLAPHQRLLTSAWWRNITTRGAGGWTLAPMPA